MTGQGALHLAAASILAVSVAACRPMIYDIDRIADPVAKARFSCQYLLERGLATEAQKDADGVLRRRIADFAEPSVTDDGGLVRTVWADGGITLRSDNSRHSGECLIRLKDQGRFVEAVSLDGRALHAGFGM